ncbi:hypothetical protein Vadar_029305 [Vaccinium darrowii]|uniref:Uncharacterized protein n=1 Tax=Vaccinium darrowii TaxID=229202 RepID=A0ACB7X4N0_9ERIC|nr:hypothetical protein Vadar_029305 [Vaccinium darrowii]
MAKNESITLKNAIHKLQLSLLEGIKTEDQLSAAGSLISRSDYQDVVTERSIASMCGYPLCNNPLPSDQPRKGRYRIALKEHKVYDLHETYMYCSTSCVVNSGTFAGSLQEERCSVLDSARLNQIMRLFEGLSLDSKEDLGKNGDLGLSELKIQERTNIKAGEVSMEEWIGPSNAVEGFVPQRNQSSKPLRVKNRKEGPKPNDAKPNKGKSMIFDEMDFKSTIITQDEYTISKLPTGSQTTVAKAKSKQSKGKGSRAEMENRFTIMEIPPSPMQTDSDGRLKEPKEEKSSIVTDVAEAQEEFHAAKADRSSAIMPKPSLKSAGSKKQIRSVSWADERTDAADVGNLCEVREMENTIEHANKSSFLGRGDDDYSVRFGSAEACAIAMSQAAEAVAHGECDASDAVSEAGIIILPPLPDVEEEESQGDDVMLEPEPTASKWPGKPGVPNYNLFESEDSWYDSPPEGLSLALSPFATMWNALFAWISSSSLAYVYGQDDSFHEEYLSVNGREYPGKIVLTDGRSSEIKQTLADCLSRALPGLIADLRLPTPLSTIEHRMGCLLDTMSFLDPLPSFRMKQWQVIVLLFIDALSVSRIPALIPYMTSRRTLLNKVLEGAQIRAEEYEMMKDLLIPLGRVPQFSTQSGG